MDFLNRWRRSWRQSPRTCLVFGVVCFWHVAIPIGVGGAILVVSVWFPPDLSETSFARLVGIVLFYTLLPWYSFRLTGWLNRQWWALKYRLDPF